MDMKKFDEAIGLYEEGNINRGEFKSMMYEAMDIISDDMIVVGSHCGSTSDNMSEIQVALRYLKRAQELLKKNKWYYEGLDDMLIDFEMDISNPNWRKDGA